MLVAPAKSQRDQEQIINKNKNEIVKYNVGLKILLTIFSPYLIRCI
jgi:hypothetical protein